ncbi:MAG: DALR anticodon-binding domain-containing protein [Coprococcus sp.]
MNVDDRDLKNARVMLTYLTKNTIAEALNLLGIEAPEAM